ncbi:MAG: 3-methyl-2-oxobutanoate hydroxymethyltransferase [Bacillota bacterium]
MEAPKKKPTVLDFLEMKRSGRKITMVTAYDYAFASIVDSVDIDIILVGDSGAMTTLGYETTVPVSMEEMLAMARAVARGAKNTFLVGDMPFLSYEVSVEKAVENAGRFLKEAGMDAVKLEGGRRVAPVIQAIVRAGIPVMGHIGLTPQSLSQLGGFRVQGKDVDSARAVVEDALALQEAGAFAVVVEAVPAPVGEMITRALRVPTIGIGAGPHCDGQVLVLHDLLGLFERFVPKFVKRYANLAASAREALACFAAEVRGGVFPAPEHCYSMKPDQAAALREQLEQAGFLR